MSEDALICYVRISEDHVPEVVASKFRFLINSEKMVLSMVYLWSGWHGVALWHTVFGGM